MTKKAYINLPLSILAFLAFLVFGLGSAHAVTVPVTEQEDAMGTDDTIAAAQSLGTLSISGTSEFTVNGRIARGNNLFLDVDWYSVTITEALNLGVTIDPTGGFEPIISIQNNTRSLGSAISPTHTISPISVPAGTYFINVSLGNLPAGGNGGSLDGGGGTGFTNDYGDYTLTISATGAGTNAIPEPTTMTLLGMGLVGLAGLSRKRKG